MDARRRKAFRWKLHWSGFSQACGCRGAFEQPHGIVLYRIPNADYNAHFHGDAHANAELDAHFHAHTDANAHPHPDAHANAYINRDRYTHAVSNRHRNAVTAYSHAHGIRDAHPDGYSSTHVDAYARVLIDADGCAHHVPDGCAIIDGNPNADGNSVAAIRNSAIGETGYAHAAAANSHHSSPDGHRRRYRADSSRCDCSNAAADH